MWRLPGQVAHDLGIDTVVAYERFGTAMIPIAGGKLEFVGARKETYAAGSRKPDVAPGTLADDLRRRDFTVNALAVSLNRSHFGLLLDPFEGLADLAAQTLRTPMDPHKTFDDDPLRMLRAIRFAAQLGFTIAEDAYAGMKAMSDRLSIVSQERITDEFLKILKSAQPSVGLQADV